MNAQHDVTSGASFQPAADTATLLAKALRLAGAPAECAQLGLYEDADDYAAACRRAMAVLVERVRHASRSLYVGAMSKSVTAGFAASLTPRALDADTGVAAACDAMVLHECTHVVSPVKLFTAADRRLDAASQIVLLDQFAVARTPGGPESVRLLRHVVALAERFGYSIVEQRDLTRAALHTFDYWIELLTHHAVTLEGTVDAAIAELKDRKARHEAGTWGVFLLRLKRERRPHWRVGAIDERNAPAMRALFETIFQTPMSTAHWQWKYGGGRSAAVGVWEGDALIAHYGGLAREILYFGQPASAAQSCDVMVAPQGRATLSRQGPLFLAAATYLEDQLGYGNPHLLGYGFPNTRAWKAPARLKLYGGPVGRMIELSWPPARGRPSAMVALRPLRLASERERRDADECWAAMRADAAGHVIAVRDAAALHWRYLAHPARTYKLVIARNRFTGRPLGLFALRLDADQRCELLDVVGRFAVIPELVAHARRVAAVLGATTLFSWAVENIRSYFPPGDECELEVLVPANAWTDAPPIAEQTGKWWLTGGDTDFR